MAEGAVAKIRLALEGSPAVVSGLQAVEKQFGSLKSGIAGLAAGLTVGAFAAAIKQQLELADAMAKTAERTGLQLKDVAGLQLAYSMAGISSDKLETSIGKMAKNMAEGSKAFGAMGVQIKNSDGSLRSTRDVLGDVADKFASYRDGAEKTALAQELFGKSGTEMISVLNGGAEALAESDAQARKLGLTLDEEATAKAVQFNDTLSLLQAGGEGFTRQIAGRLAPTLASLASELLSNVGQSESLNTISAALSTTLKGLYSAGAIGAQIFANLGRAVGAGAAAIMAVLRGDFAAAKDIMSDVSSVNAAAWKGQLESLGRLWDDTGAAGVQAMATTAAAAKVAAPIVSKVGDAAKHAKDEFADLLNKINAKDAGVDASFFKDLNTLFAGYQKGRIGLDEYREAVEKLTQSQKFAQDATKQLADVDKQRAAQIEAFDKTNKDQIKTAADVLANIKFETAALKMTNAERAKAVALRDLERQGIEAGTEAYEQYAQAILTALDEKTVTEASIEAQKKIADEWQKTTDQMGQSLADALMNGGKSISEYLKGLFRNLILRPIIQPIATSLAGGFMSMFGGPAAAGQGGMSGSSALGMAGNLGSSLFGGTSFANAIGVGVGNAMSSMGITDGISGLLATNGAYGTAGGLMGAIGPALPYIGIGAMLLSTFWDDLFGKSLRDTGIQGSFSSAGFKGQTYQDYEGGIFSSDSFDTQDLPEQIARPMSEAWAKITKDVTHYADVLGLQSDKIAGFTHEFKLSLGDSEIEGDALTKAINDKLTEALKSGSNALAQELIGSWTETMERVTRTTLAGPGLGGEGGDGGWTTTYEEDVKRRTYKPSEFAREGEDAITTLTRLATSLQGVNAIFDTLGLKLYEASLKGGDMASQLADAAGGLDKLQAASASYFQNFYTGSEQHATALRHVREQFDELDVAMPRSRQEFRALVESLDLTTEAGRALYAGLLGISDAFAAVTPNLFGAAQTMTDAITQGMLGTFDGGNLGAYMAQTVSDGIYNAVAGYFAQQVTDILVSGVINPVIQAAITGSTVSGAVSQASIAASIDAANAAMAAMAAIVNDPAFQELMGQITGAVGAIKVPTIKRATASVQSYTSAVSASGSAASSAADEAQRAAEQIKKAWQSIGDSLMDEVNRIRGVLNETAGQGVDYWQAQFAIAKAQALAGDQEAAKSLTSISQNLLRAGETSADSMLELQRLRAQVAQSLQDVAGFAHGGGVVAPPPSQNQIGQGPVSWGDWTLQRPTVTLPNFARPSASDESTVAELRALRQSLDALIASNRADTDLQRRAVRVLERMDTLGMPAERTEA